jgi:hypothetical protein
LRPTLRGVGIDETMAVLRFGQHHASASAFVDVTVLTIGLSKIPIMTQ